MYVQNDNLAQSRAAATIDDIIVAHGAKLEARIRQDASESNHEIQGPRRLVRARRVAQSGAAIRRARANFTVCDITFHC